MIKKLKSYLKKNRHNTSVKINIDNYTLIAPATHKIEFYLNKFKHYSRNLGRIAKYIEAKYTTYSILDIGANIGDSVALLRSAGVLQTVHAVEGEPSYYEILEQNITQFSDCVAYNCFLGEHTQQEQLNISADEGTATLRTDSKKLIDVEKLDDFIQHHSLTNVKLLKIDTDGFDLKILRGSFSYLRQLKPVLFFEYDASYIEEQGDDAIKIFDDLAKLGYKKILYYDNFGKFLLSITTKDTLTINQLYDYLPKGESAFFYYDLCIFHEDDDNLADEVIQKEMTFFTAEK
ncbi:FkbM family methyltransferase [Pedobacter sp. P351]|uniref:FkbM family methyltransferase n=1 Tax=Pedobacter superstes TaxID=3133441 RepID=UPI0030A46D8B